MHTPSLTSTYAFLNYPISSFGRKTVDTVSKVHQKCSHQPAILCPSNYTKMHINASDFQKFPGGACPRTPLVGLGLRPSFCRLYASWQVPRNIPVCPILLIYRNAAWQVLVYFFCNPYMSLKSEVWSLKEFLFFRRTLSVISSFFASHTFLASFSRSFILFLAAYWLEPVHQATIVN